MSLIYCVENASKFFINFKCFSGDKALEMFEPFEESKTIDLLRSMVKCTAWKENGVVLSVPPIVESRRLGSLQSSVSHNVKCTTGIGVLLFSKYRIIHD